jgi:hypothetical protein
MFFNLVIQRYNFSYYSHIKFYLDKNKNCSDLAGRREIFVNLDVRLRMNRVPVYNGIAQTVSSNRGLNVLCFSMTGIFKSAKINLIRQIYYPKFRYINWRIQHTVSASRD